MRRLAILLGAVLAVGSLPVPATAATSDAAGPVTNGDFELPPVTRTVEVALDGSPLDRCYGFGHQVDYGSQTPQAEATGGPFGEPDPEEASPFGALEMIIQDPEGTADQQTDCVWSAGDGYDVAHVHPAAATMTPTGWTVDIAEPSVEFGYGFDDDVTDREAKILADDEGASRNLWQVFDPAQQAYTPNADALEVTVEEGAISDRAQVEIGLEPVNDEAPASGEWGDCRLDFDADQLQAALTAGDPGHLAADPVEAEFSAANDACRDLAQAWRDADGEEDKRRVLAQTRIVEIVFWDWNAGTTEPTVIDDVQLVGASTIAEETTPL